MEPTERNKPLKACPHLSCRRSKTCHTLARGKACLITHFKNDDEWYDYMATKIRRITRRSKPDPARAELSEDELMAIMYRALKDRLAEFDALAPSD